MKHYLPNSLRALFLSLAVLLSLPMLAHHFEMGRIYYNILSSEERTVEVTFYGSNYNTQTNEYSGHVTIPESVTYSGITYSVVAINSNTFLMCQDVTGVTIPRTIERIGVGAFGVNEAETDFTTLRISDLEAWCNIDFEAGSSNPMSNAEYIYLNDILISDLAIPEGVKEIKSYAFAMYHNPINVIIPNSVESIGDDAFYYCSGLTSVTIGNGVKSIGSGAFWGCSNLLDVYCYAENVPYTEI